MRSFPLRAVALAATAFCTAAAHSQATPPPTSELEKVTVTGQGDRLGTGLMIDEDAPKSRSSVTKAQLDKTRSSGNPFQALSLLPGVNSSSYDATGLFGGNLRVRGFNSDQMGFTVNGAPVNDSGNFAVFPQEYIDQEDLCSLYVTQGAADADAPHVGASGGNVGIISCAPEDRQRVRVAFSAGQLDYHRIYARIDTGKVGDFKAFVSVSQSEAHKWKGYGEANRDHLDSSVEYALGGGNLLSASLLFNHAVNNNFLAATPATFAANYYADFGNTVPQHVPPANGTAQVDKIPVPNYAGYSLNPFDDGLLTGRGSFNLGERLKLEVQPYFWYGYGTGGNQQVLLAESSGGGNLHGGIADINADRDTLDTVLVYRGSLTKTLRPGITATLNYTLDDFQKITGGLWYERAHHRQTAPATTVDNAGNIGDLWLGTGLLKYNDGATYQNRDWLTISTGEAVFVQDAVDLLDHKLTIIPAISYRRIHREFTNNANSGVNGGVDYRVSQSYSKPLPSLGVSYAASDRIQVFSSVQKSFRVPSNFEFGNLARGTTFAGGAGTATRLADLGVKPESSVNFDLGGRYRGDAFSGSATVFYNKFKDRIASSYNFADQSTTDTNVGPSTAKGVEIEAGSVPIGGFSAYVSGSYTKSTIKDNLLKTVTAGAPVYYNTSGKQFPDTPKGMAAVSLQYATGPYLLNVSGKYTTSRSLTLSDDVIIKGFTTFDLNAAYKFPNGTGNGFKNPIVRLNVSNVLNRKYLLANAGSGSNVTPDATGNPVAYAGAPRFASVTFQVDY